MATETLIEGKLLQSASVNFATMAATASSRSVSLKNVKQLAVFLKWDAGTHVGTVTIEVSPDRKDANPPTKQLADQDADDTAANWFPLIAAQMQGTIPAVTNGAALSTLIVIPQCSFRRGRVTYTFVSGTGVLNAWFNGVG